MIIEGLVEEKHKVRVLLDTGSQATLVSLSTVKLINADNRIVPTQRTLSSFTQTTIETIGEVKLLLAIAEKCAWHTCIVVPTEMESNILLGLDYMKPNNISIHFGENCVKSEFGKSQFKSDKIIAKRTKVRLAKTTVVPPNTVMFISGNLPDKKLTTCSGYLEPYVNTMIKNEGILIGSSLNTSSKGIVPVSCINSSDEAVTLFKHSLLGFMTPFDMDGHLRGLKVNSVKDSTENTQSDTTPVVNEWEKDKLFAALRIPELKEKLKESEMKRLKDILWQNRQCFSRHENDIGNCNFFKAEILLKPNHSPKWTPSRPIAYKLQGEMKKMIDGMLQSGVIEECKTKSYWNSAVFLVSKPFNRGWRFVADFRGVNNECLPDGYELPNVNRVTDTIGGCTLYSTFDLSKSFHQIEYKDEAKQITAFSVGNRRYVFRRMVMGHLSSSSQFTRMMDKLVQSIPDIRQLIYFLDDLLLASNTVDEHLTRLELILSKFKSSNLKLTPSKCSFLSSEVRFIGYKISKHGISITDDRVKAVKDLKPPTTVKETEKLMGFLAYNRRFVPRFSALAKPIYALIKRPKDLKKPKAKEKFVWTEICDTNFRDIKRLICEGITLGIPDIDDPHQSYHVKIDASLDGLGAELSQLINGKRQTIAFFSRRVPSHKRTWSQTKLEFEAMLAAIENWRVYLQGTKFTVITDCISLLDFQTIFSNANAHQVRQLQRLAKYRFVLKHIAGEENEICDFLSRYGQKPEFLSKFSQTEDVDVKTSVEESVNQVTQEAKNEDNMLIPPSLFDPDQHADTSSKVLSKELQLATPPVTKPCYCNTPQAPEGEVKINTIDTSESTSTPLSPPEIQDLEMLKKSQGEDPMISEVMKWVQTGKKPTAIQALRAPADLVRLWRSFDLLTIHNGLLARKWVFYHRNSKMIEVVKRLYIIPEDKRVETMTLAHSTLLSNHPGVEETLRQLRQHFYWPNMHEDVRLFVEACVTCGKAKQPRAYLKAPLKHIIASEFNDVIVIDHIVPERDVLTKRRNRYILSITDLFTGYVLTFQNWSASSAVLMGEKFWQTGGFQKRCS